LFVLLHLVEDCTDGLKSDVSRAVPSQHSQKSQKAFNALHKASRFQNTITAKILSGALIVCPSGSQILHESTI